MHRFAGIYTPLATPFAADGRLDTRALAHNVDKYLQSPLTGLVVLGSNGEATQLDEDEADLAIKTVRDATPRHRPLLAGTGRESTAATIAATTRAADLGVDAVLVRTAPLSKLVGAQYGVPGLKAAITLCGFEGGYPRPPLQPVPRAAIDAIRAALAELNLVSSMETSDVAR